tara:strand:+ start:5792 stop:6448 length:657 start_codon:yes stop_codon:yes gene_type:complete
MYEEEKWRDVPAELANKIIETVKETDGRYGKPTTTTRVRQCSLPFYESTTLVRLSEPETGDDTPDVYFLLVDDELYPLDGHSIAIHEHNKKESINLTRDNVTDYIRFFGLFTTTHRGPFLVLERADDPLISYEGDTETRELLEKLLKPAEVTRETEEGHFECVACLLYGYLLTLATFEVRKDGTVDIIKDQPIDGIKVTVNAPFSYMNVNWPKITDES